jgi:beta-aspartyl-peptidase (threonine type)
MKTVGENRGTVNFIAIDRKGDMASAVTTSGWAYKYPGRVGDSPIVGAGNYCDTRYGGACCTGFGELAIRNVTAKTAVDGLASGMSALEVAKRAIADVNALDDAAFNIVVLRSDGMHASATNREGRQYAFMTTEMTSAETRLRTVVAADTRPRPTAVFTKT